MPLPRRRGIVLHSSDPVKNAACRSPLGSYSGQAWCRHPLRRSWLRLITAHRILIASAIVACLFYAGREVVLSFPAHSVASFLRIGLAVAAAVALALYLRSLRTP